MVAPGSITALLRPGVLPRLAGLPDPQVSPDQARQKADEILSRQEFQRPPKSAFEQVTSWIQEHLVGLLERLFSGGTGAAAAWLLVGLIVAALAFLIWRVTRTVQKDPGVKLAMSVAVRRSAADWRLEAERHEATGEWKEALRCRFRSLVGDLVDRGKLRDVPGRTAGEYRRELRETAPAVATDFSRAAELFEQAWYGDVATGPEENALFRSLADGLLTGVGT